MTAVFASLSWSIALGRGVCSWQPALMRATLLGMGLLERGSFLASLAGYAREARQGDGRLVLVAGEAGVGKSALVEQFQCDLPDARWSWGACDGLFTPRPLGPLLDIADQLGGELLDLCRASAGRDELFVLCCARSANRGRWTWWLWRTSTGPMRRPLTCCGSWAGESGTLRCCCL